MPRKAPHSPQTQFKEGQSGNPNGRPPKLPHIDALLEDVLGEVDKYNKSSCEKILRAIKKKAEAGDVRCAELLFDRKFGKVAQQMNLTGGPIFEATVFVLPNGRKVEI